MTELDDILEQHKEWLRGVRTDRLIGVGTEPTKQSIKELIIKIIKDSDAYVNTAGDSSVWRSEKSILEEINKL